MADAHTFTVVGLPMPAGRLTGPGTDPAQHPGQDIRPPVQFIRAAVTFLVNTPDISRDICPGGAGRLAGHAFGHLAEIPGIR